MNTANQLPHHHDLEEDDAPPMRRHRRSERTGERLLEAGRKMVLKHGMSSTLPVRISDVVASVGQTTGAAYQLWPSQEKFQRALADYLLESTFWVEPRTVIDGIRARLDQDSISFSATIRDICGALMGCLVGQPEYYVHLHFWAVAFHEADMREAMRRGYERFHGEFTALYDAVFEKYAVRLREPYTMDDLATTITAIAEGFAIRSLVDAQRAGILLNVVDVAGEPRWDLYTSAVEAVVIGFTTPAAVG
jgi:AcrR family transcriptional regulator